MFFPPDGMCIQTAVPAQPTRVNVSKVRLPEPVASLMRKMRGTRNHCGAGTSKD